MALAIAVFSQTTDLDHCVAEELFGWQWLSFVGRPIRGHPEYNSTTLRVRQFMSAHELQDLRWAEYLASKDARPATGDEPLAYCYCSSCGPSMVPNFSGDASDATAMEKEVRRRKLWPQYIAALAVQCHALKKDGSINAERLMRAGGKSRCIAALVSVGSKYVTEANA